MSSIPQIHWHEGLFLQPHHLQYLQRQLMSQMSGERRLAFTHPTGVIEARLSTDALENMLVQFDRLRVVMPSGLVLNVPHDTDLPALDIKRTFEASTSPFLIRIGVPLWYASRGNAIETPTDDDWRVKRLWRVKEVEEPDENSGENAKPVRVRRFNARLLLPDDDQSDLEVLPLLRIAHATGEQSGMPRQDPNYVPPCLLLSGSPTLRELVRDLAQQVEASRSELVNQVRRGGFSLDSMRGIQFEQILRLRTLNRYAARIPALVTSPGISPFDMYLELRELLGELAALSPNEDPWEVARYDHDNPAVAFHDLAAKIRPLLRGIVSAPYLKADFVQEGKIMSATLTDEQTTRPIEYYLAIKTRTDPMELASLVEDVDKFKFMPKSMVFKNLWGVKLDYERNPPLGLPPQTDLHYFRLLRGESDKMWNRVCEEKSIGVRWLGIESSDFQMSLYMTVADQ